MSHQHFSMQFERLAYTNVKVENVGIRLVRKESACTYTMLMMISCRLISTPQLSLYRSGVFIPPICSHPLAVEAERTLHLRRSKPLVLTSW